MTSESGACAETSELLLEAVAQSADIIFVTDPDHSFAFVSRGVIELLALPRAALVGEPILAIVAPDDHPVILDVMDAARTGDAPGTQLVELRLSSSNVQEPVTAELSLRPVIVDRRFRGCVGVARNISGRAAHLDERLASERVNAVVGLAKEAAHQINNPLAIITVHLGVIEKATEAGKPASPEAIEQMRTVINRIAEVTRDLAIGADTMIQKSVLGAPVADIATGDGPEAGP